VVGDESCDTPKLAMKEIIWVRYTTHERPGVFNGFAGSYH